VNKYSQSVGLDNFRFTVGTYWSSEWSLLVRKHALRLLNT